MSHIESTWDEDLLEVGSASEEGSKTERRLHIASHEHWLFSTTTLSKSRVPDVLRLLNKISASNGSNFFAALVADVGDPIAVVLGDLSR